MVKKYLLCITLCVIFYAPTTRGQKQALSTEKKTSVAQMLNELHRTLTGITTQEKTDLQSAMTQSARIIQEMRLGKWAQLTKKMAATLDVYLTYIETPAGEKDARTKQQFGRLLDESNAFFVMAITRKTPLKEELRARRIIFNKLVGVATPEGRLEERLSSPSMEEIHRNLKSLAKYGATVPHLNKKIAALLEDIGWGTK